MRVLLTMPYYNIALNIIPTLYEGYILMGKRQKAIYRLVTAPQGGTQKYTLAFAYYSPR